MNNDKTPAPFISRKRPAAIAVAVLAIASVLMVFLCCALGSARFSMGELLDAVQQKLTGVEDSSATGLILFGIRLPRALLSYVVGAALSISGVCMQGVFKNPMADPHILGVSSGAALGAALVIVSGAQNTALGVGALPIGAFAGGALAVLFVLSLSRVRGRTSTVTLLLSGVAVSTFLSAMLSGILTLNHDKMESVYLWTMGSFTAATWTKIAILTPIVAIGFLILRTYARDLNAMMMGEEEARSLGVNVARTQIIVLGASTLITATAVAFSGVIGFVGLMVPHAVRMLTGPDHRLTLPVSLLAGGLYLMLMDTIARTAFLPTELPVGVLTALIGGPFFLFLLKKSKNQL